MLDTLGSKSSSVDRAAVRSKKLRKAKTEIANTSRGRLRQKWPETEDARSHSRRLRKWDTQKALDRAGACADYSRLVELDGRS